MTTIRPRCAAAGCDQLVPRRGARFCCRACYRTDLRATPSPAVPLPSCRSCGGPKPRQDRPYCGRGCSTAARQVPRPPCRSCGQPVARPDQPFCSLGCSRTWQRQHPSRPWAGLVRPEIRGAAHPNWRGDAASPAAKRRRLRLLYPQTQRCAICWLPGVRRARDGDASNQAPGNVLWRCRTCLARFHRKRHHKRRSRSRS